nr:uncharacterized protein LOC107441385 [Parasteatoda tepidariorum]
MKVFSIFGFYFVAVVVCASGLTEKKKEEKFESIYICVACSKDESARDEYLKCENLKSAKIRENDLACQIEVFPDVTTTDEQFDEICRHPETTAKLYDCIKAGENETVLTSEDKERYHDFRACRRELSQKYCEDK